jgi:hypothetical protein
MMYDYEEQPGSAFHSAILLKITLSIQTLKKQLALT